VSSVASQTIPAEEFDSDPENISVQQSAQELRAETTRICENSVLAQKDGSVAAVREEEVVRDKGTEMLEKTTTSVRRKFSVDCNSAAYASVSSCETTQQGASIRRANSEALERLQRSQEFSEAEEEADATKTKETSDASVEEEKET